MPRHLSLPLDTQTLSSLKPGENYLLSGEIFTARDQAHKRMLELLESGETLPFDLRTASIFYCGPSPTPPGKICGSVGPTTSSRMDPYTPLLIECGLRVMIGKGERSTSVQKAIREYEAVYLVCSGGVAALLSRCIVSCETYAWPELGAEAVYRLVVKDLPVNCALV
jgi:fumarate hydratase subunit beta